MRHELSPDLAENMPHFNLKTRITRHHIEKKRNLFLPWIMEDVLVIDHIEMVSLTVTQEGRTTWEIPLAASQSSTPEEEPTKSQTEVLTPSK